MKQFDLNKSSNRDFNLSKGGKRHFDLTKDEQVTPPAPEPTPEPEPDGKGSNWLLLIVGVVLIAALVWWIVPKGSDKEDAIAEEVHTEVISGAEETSIDEGVIDITASADSIVAQEEPEGDIENQSEMSESTSAKPEPVKQTASNVAATSAATGDVEEEALKVIRGEYGNGAVRRNNLGANYEAIQRRVNAMKRQGLF
ncbi:MAG: hypothetical protein K2G35_02360 [Duncaniella sp.]|nr:hypothetical protein [Duncaniella sp.]